VLDTVPELSMTTAEVRRGWNEARMVSRAGSGSDGTEIFSSSFTFQVVWKSSCFMLVSLNSREKKRSKMQALAPDKSGEVQRRQEIILGAVMLALLGPMRSSQPISAQAWHSCTGQRIKSTNSLLHIGNLIQYLPPIVEILLF